MRALNEASVADHFLVGHSIMKRIFLLTLLASTLAGVNPLFAQEPVESEIEFVQRLRAKGWNDLAQARIDELLKRNNPTLNAVLPYESARIKVSEARLKGPEQRVALFNS